MEPEFGGSHIRAADKSSTTWDYTVALGLAASWGASATKAVVGVRIGATEAGTKTSRTKASDGGALLGLVVGAEHFATSGFSLGAEARVTYVGIGSGGVFIEGVAAARVYY